MSTVIIKIDTGFVGATHEEDTGLTVEEWKALSQNEKWDWQNQAIQDHIDTYIVCVDEDGNEADIED